MRRFKFAFLMTAMLIMAMGITACGNKDNKNDTTVEDNKNNTDKTDKDDNGNIIDGVEGAVDGVGDAGKDVIDGAEDAVDGVGEAGKDVIDGTGNTVNNATDKMEAD